MPAASRETEAVQILRRLVDSIDSQDRMSVAAWEDMAADAYADAVEFLGKGGEA